MGVHGLWELLAPVGRRVSVETLAGKKLAIDASIWMIQFMKAMRDDTGEMVKNAHLLGFFRRICKLLFLRTKPVFVFDGGTPALKRRTVIARRKQRENAQAKIRKIAEKLLLNHLKSLRLKELANDIENQRRVNNSQGKNAEPVENEVLDDQSKHKNRVLRGHDQEKLDEMLAASIAAEEDGRLTNRSPTSKGVFSEEEEEDAGLILPEIAGEVDPVSLDALPPNVQMRGISTAKDLKNQRVDKGKTILSDEINLRSESEEKEPTSRKHEQERLDAMLAASIASEEGTRFNYASTSAAAVLSDEEDNDTDEEMILPEMPGIVDRQVLDSLPLSMRLDLFSQMKERQMAENRQKYQEVKKAPDKFSELQIQSYLKAVALRREINQVQKAASGIGVGGVQTSRIASEANKEFIFSSSFTGDKDVLASAGIQRGDDAQNSKQMGNYSEYCSTFPFTSITKIVSESASVQSKKALDDGVETFLDEMGHIRVSRVRAMGIRMTRDLQRNLDLMKELEQGQTSSHAEINRLMRDENSSEVSHSDNGKSIDLHGKNESSVLVKESSIRISFEDDGGMNGPDEDEEVFACLVAGNSTTISSAEKFATAMDDSASDVDWEEGNVYTFPQEGEVDTKTVLDKGCIDDKTKVEWEEGTSTCPDGDIFTRASSRVLTSKGSLEEYAELQEALRRSLQDKKHNIASTKDEKQQLHGVHSYEHITSCASPDTVDEQLTLSEDITKLESDVIDGDDSAHGTIILQQDERDLSEGASVQLSKQGNVEKGNLLKNEGLSKSMLPVEPNFDADNLSNITPRNNEVPASAKEPTGISCQISSAMHKNDTVLSRLTSERVISEAQLESSGYGNDVCCKHIADDSCMNKELRDLQNVETPFIVETNEDVNVDMMKSSLEEEMQRLNQECEKLGNEQKKFERNAESVSSEMFTECQELLQMFGLPYIIAPMEAEAQCAYLEMENLVDGVVTDDSDVFLFGAGSVYKNIFDDRKYVETYFMKDIEKELGLSKEKLIRMALLLGSDYTEGISGIGIVNAVEVLNAFPEEDGLQKFRQWIESPDASILGKVNGRTGSTPRKRGSRGTKGATDGIPVMEQNDSCSDLDNIQELKQYFMDRHRNVSKNWHIPPSFPSEIVISAYSSPQVDKSDEPFSWGKPDIFILRKLCWEKFGWSSQKADELLLPVLNEYNKHETQLRLEAFYTFNEKFAKIRSKRITKAVKGMSGRQSSELIDDAAAEDNARNRKKRTGRAGDLQQRKSAKHSNGTEEATAGRVTQRQSRKRKGSGHPMVAEQGQLETTKLAEGSANKISRGNKRGGGRGRSQRGIHSPSISEASFVDGSSDDNELEICDKKLKGLQEVRRSGRNRKAVNYLEDIEGDEGNRSFLQDDSSVQNTDGDGAVGFHPENDSSTQTHPLIQSSSLENLAGGFCTDEDDTEQVGRGDGDDYLRMGGGFCAEDSETDADIEGLGNPMRSLLQSEGEDNGNPKFADMLEDDVVQLTTDELYGPEKVSSPVQHTLEPDKYASTYTPRNANASCDSDNNNVKGDQQISLRTSFSAMPFLRRKRKNS
ncbi:hypothetical protein SAY87_008532 [Trapa incisa]|uniref:DNA repair protein UVH3 n=1 Tax=Trapa incisa TaxID=236973 RepID=A0AAN7Q0X2_9MYRT|nr:hypothetical protein SAY87_008532 [Trapa incisa]